MSQQPIMGKVNLINFKTRNFLSRCVLVILLNSSSSFVVHTDSAADNSSSQQRLNQSEKSSFTAYKANSNGENSSSKSNLNCILQNYSKNSVLMKNSSSGSEKDSMSENSDDESEVDIVGDGMLCWNSIKC